MILLLLATLAWASEPQIKLIPEGSQITKPPELGSAPLTVETKSFLLPESHYDRCLISAANLTVCEEALGEVSQVKAALTQATTALASAKDKMEEDEILIEDLTLKVATLEAQVLTEKSRTQRVRNQRNLAWGITGGVLAGATAAGVITLSN